MPIDYSKLRGRIVEVYGSQGEFSRKMGWSERTTSLKMNGHVSWKQDEILRAKDLLKLNDEDILIYFFTIKVQSNELKKKKYVDANELFKSLPDKQAESV